MNPKGVGWSNRTKSFRSLGYGLLIIIGIGLAARAQLTSSTEPPAPADSIVQLTAEAQGLESVSRENLPENGTFWVVTPENGVTAPWPCPPRDVSLPVFQIAEGQFIVDATGGKVSLNPWQGEDVTVESALASLADSVVNLISWIQGVQTYRELTASMGLDIPTPGEGEGGTNYYESGYTAQVFTTNDLWLEISGTTNTGSGWTAALVIHPPWNVTNGVYDLFATTNLAPSAWQWVLRCDPGQTNLTLTGRADPMEFYILGLTTDTDADGLTDAYETLVSHTDPNVFTAISSDGMGTPDAWYLQNGINPLAAGVAGEDPDQDGLLNYQEYRYGTRPQVSEGFRVWVGQPGTTSSLP